MLLAKKNHFRDGVSDGRFILEAKSDFSRTRIVERSERRELHSEFISSRVKKGPAYLTRKGVALAATQYGYATEYKKYLE